MRLVFAGTPEFAARALDALVAAGHQVELVLCQPDRPAGRGLKLAACAVKQRAQAHGLEVLQPETLKSPEAQSKIREVGADAMVVAAYGLLLPKAVLESCRLGALNIHASLLPRWRGAAPIQRALMAGDAQTGVCIMQMDEGLDTGPVRLRREIAIDPQDDAGTLHDRLAALGAAMIVEALATPDGPSTAQSSDGVTYARKIGREDARLDWSRSAGELERVVRAMRPSPGAVADLDGEPVKIWSAQECSGTGEPGKILAAQAGGITVACGRGALRLLEIQRPGGKRLAAGEFLRGARLSISGS